MGVSKVSHVYFGRKSRKCRAPKSNKCLSRMCCAACVFIGPTHIILALFRVSLLHDFGNSSSWQQILSPRLDENKIQADCEQLYVVLKNCDAPDQGARDAESIKALYRLVFLLSYRHGSKRKCQPACGKCGLCNEWHCSDGDHDHDRQLFVSPSHVTGDTR